jgi:hypothetical protein
MATGLAPGKCSSGIKPSYMPWLGIMTKATRCPAREAPHRLALRQLPAWHWLHMLTLTIRHSGSGYDSSGLFSDVRPADVMTWWSYDEWRLGLKRP